MLLSFIADQASSELWSRFASLGKIVVFLSTAHSKDKQKADSNDTSDFFTTPGAVLSLCHLQQRLEELPIFQRLCAKTLYSSDATCCPTWSLANFISRLVGKSSCSQVRFGYVTTYLHLNKMKLKKQFGKTGAPTGMQQLVDSALCRGHTEH